MPKAKVHSGAAKRFKKAGSGYKRKSAYKSHILTKMTTKRKRQLRELAADQSFIEQAPVVLVWLADFSRAQQLADAAGVPLAAATFAIFAIVLVILRFAAKRRAAAPA